MKRYIFISTLLAVIFAAKANQKPDSTLYVPQDSVEIIIDDFEEEIIFSDDSSDDFSVFDSPFSNDEGDSFFTSDNLAGLSWGGYLRGSLFGGGKAFDLTNAFSEIALQPRFVKDKTIFKSDIRFRGGMFFNEEQTQLELKELYAGYTSDKLDLILGNQIVFWGRTDGFNPTNNISPNDLFFLTGEPDDQRMSNFMFRMKYRLVPSIELDFIAIPFYKASNYRFDLFDLTPNIDLEGIPTSLLPEINVDVGFEEMLRPVRKIENGTVGARMNFELPDISFALSFFSGFDPFHGFDMEAFSLDMTNTDQPISLRYRPKPYLKNSLGADFAIPSGSWIVKGEMAYNFVRNKNNEMYIPKSDFSYVFGFERMWGDFVFIGQYIGKAVTDFQPLEEPQMGSSWNLVELMNFAEEFALYESQMVNRRIFNQQEKLNSALSLTVQGNFAYETWGAEMTAYYNLTSKELLLRPKVQHRFNEALSISAGANYMHGKEGTLFGYSRQVLSGAFLELKVMF